MYGRLHKEIDLKYTVGTSESNISLGGRGRNGECILSPALGKVMCQTQVRRGRLVEVGMVYRKGGSLERLEER
jgi:hypothetical protein